MHSSNMNNGNMPDYYQMGIEGQGKFVNNSGMQMGLNGA
jgi:hypothetical protein